MVYMLYVHVLARNFYANIHTRARIFMLTTTDTAMECGFRLAKLL